MVELSNRGNATVATTSCESTLFPAAQIEMFSTLGAPTDSSTRSNVSRSFRSILHQTQPLERSNGKKKTGDGIQNSGVAGVQELQNPKIIQSESKIEPR